MAPTTANSIAKAPAANTDDKAPETSDSLPPITKEPAGTADVSMIPSLPTGSTATDAPVAPSSDAAAKPEVPAEGDVREDVAKKASEADNLAPQPEKPSEPAPTPVAQPATTGTVASGASATPNGEAAKPPQPVSVEEVHDEDLPNAKSLESEKPAETATKADATAPVATSGKEKSSANISASAKNGNGATGNKRKAEMTEDDSTKANGADQPLKKQKTNGSATNGAGRKPGRPRKEKQKAAAPVGRTARKTRSQGAPDQL